MSLSDFMALHDLAVEAGVIVPFMFNIEDLGAMIGDPSMPHNTMPQMAAFYAFTRSLGYTEQQARAAYRFAVENAI